MGRALDVIVEKDRKRYHMLRKLYETEGSRRDPVNFFELARAEGFTREDAVDALSYLEGEGLAKAKWMADEDAFATISHRGVIEVEQSIRQPTTATEHFTPAVIQQHFHAPVGSVQNAPHSTAHVMQNIGGDLQGVLDVLAKLPATLTALPAAQQPEAADLVDGLEAEAKAPTPSVSRMRAFATTLGALAKTAGATALTEVVKKLIDHLAGRPPTL